MQTLVQSSYSAGDHPRISQSDRNGVYAATMRKTEDKGSGFEPTLRATTKNLGTSVEIRIRDNGTGIRPTCSKRCSTRSLRPSQPVREPAWSLDDARHHREATRRQN